MKRRIFSHACLIICLLGACSRANEKLPRGSQELDSLGIPILTDYDAIYRTVLSTNPRVVKYNILLTPSQRRRYIPLAKWFASEMEKKGWEWEPQTRQIFLRTIKDGSMLCPINMHNEKSSVLVVLAAESILDVTSSLVSEVIITVQQKSS